MFFECVVARRVWQLIAEVFEVTIKECIDDVTKFWYKKRIWLYIIWVVLLPCGAFGAYEMRFVTRGEHGEM